MRYNGPGNFEYPTALGVSPDGSTVFVTGASTGATSGDDYATVAYDATTGAQRWVKRYNGPANGGDDASALGVSPDGSKVFVTGVSSWTSGSFNYATVAYNATTGAQLWVTGYTGPNNYDSAFALGVSPDGSKVFVTGESTGATSGYDYATAAYNATTGTQLWAERYDGPGNVNDAASALGVTPDGSTVLVTGYSGGSTSSGDYATLAYNATTGAKLWVKRYNGPGNDNDAASALGVSPDGSKVFVTGKSAAASFFLDYATVAYSVT
jgi:hypothetical protein